MDAVNTTIAWWADPKDPNNWLRLYRDSLGPRYNGILNNSEVGGTFDPQLTNAEALAKIQARIDSGKYPIMLQLTR